MIYDSTFVIALERRRSRAAAERLLERYQDQPARLPIIAFGELAAGYATLNELRANLEPAFTIEPLTEAIAWQASRVQLACAAAGTPIGENDTWIAAFALAFNEPLVSRDKDFDRVVTTGFSLQLIRF
ncbi:MAG: type II toxin-antitoxin system VapC family toxin [Verrucomicrobia bacterium]|nr:type II toxin-antitoxin system VapC family toxin [Verrucomicrobiota bacterium]